MSDDAYVTSVTYSAIAKWLYATLLLTKKCLDKNTLNLCYTKAMFDAFIYLMIISINLMYY